MIEAIARTQLFATDALIVLCGVVVYLLFDDRDVPHGLWNALVAAAAATAALSTF